MKRILFLIFLITIGARAQDCKFSINKVDDFTKEKIVAYDGFKLIGGYSFNYSMQFGAIDNLPFFVLSVNHSGASSIVVGTTEPSFFILLNDGQIISFVSNSIKGGEFLLGGTILETLYPISADDLKKIDSIGIKKIKFEADGFVDEQEIQKPVKKLNQSIKCLLSEIS